jgi:hypothetical protein
MGQKSMIAAVEAAASLVPSRISAISA